jgi:hypothetical protein
MLKVVLRTPQQQQKPETALCKELLLKIIDLLTFGIFFSLVNMQFFHGVFMFVQNDLLCSNLKLVINKKHETLTGVNTLVHQGPRDEW